MNNILSSAVWLSNCWPPTLNWPAAKSKYTQSPTVSTFFLSSIHLLNIEYVSTFDRHRAQDKLKKPDASNPSLVIQPWKTFDEENNTRQLYYCSALLIIYSQNISCPILEDMSKTFFGTTQPKKFKKIYLPKIVSMHSAFLVGALSTKNGTSHLFLTHLKRHNYE